ncbi:integral membrane protein 2C-like [Limulus polyphemus]|uniref:Integral membrane protein 2 n=1 Tax=Limulus polyphemus TaxID=6850 RepID=A0ABM1BV52_LIMPO|nr:integral membrane protein 2C-like [Limulus polyphemus]
MTIVTQGVTEKKLSQQKEPLVTKEVSEVENGHVEVGHPKAKIVRFQERARRVNSATTLCVFVTALLVLTFGIIGGVCLYRQFSQYKFRQFRGRCSVPYNVYASEQKQVVTNGFRNYKESFEKNFSTSSSNMVQATKNPYKNFFTEEFEIDIEYEEYEQIEVPDFSHGRHGRFIHDFIVNKTGIVDLEGRRCFVMPLNRKLIYPPHSLVDLMLKMEAGYYDVNTEIVRERMYVITPPITDKKIMGYHIARACSAFPTYHLERMPISKANANRPQRFNKRSVEKDENNVFVEFAGPNISEIQIINLHHAVGAPVE